MGTRSRKKNRFSHNDAHSFFKIWNWEQIEIDTNQMKTNFQTPRLRAGMETTLTLWEYMYYTKTPWYLLYKTWLFLFNECPPKEKKNSWLEHYVQYKAWHSDRVETKTAKNRENKEGSELKIKNENSARQNTTWGVNWQAIELTPFPLISPRKQNVSFISFLAVWKKKCLQCSEEFLKIN